MTFLGRTIEEVCLKPDMFVEEQRLHLSILDSSLFPILTTRLQCADFKHL